MSRLLADKWPAVTVELDHQNAYQLLVATILSAQSTDKMINTLTPALFEKYPDPAALAQAEQADVEQLVFKSGFYRMKAKHLIEMARAVVAKHDGEIPDTMEALVALPGVARKTANVVLGFALGKNEGVIVDTHVMRVSNRLGITAQTDAAKIEADLMAVLPREEWNSFANRMIHHGRYICIAKAPDCEHCNLAPVCPSAMMFQLDPASRPEHKQAKPVEKPPKAAAKDKPGVVKKAKAVAKAMVAKVKK